MKISRIEKNDFEAVLDLNEKSMPHVNRIDHEQLQWFVEHAAFANVAKIDQRIAGFLIGLRPGTEYASPNYRWFCDNYDDFCYVDRVAVSEWARRQGVAKTLYDEYARSQSGVPIITCEVNIRPPNDRSMRFHQQLDFQQVGSQETENGNKEVAFLKKRLGG